MDILAIDDFVDNPTAKILVVDDLEANKKLIVEILELEGYSVESASDGKEALEKLKAGDFDLVISDIDMPEMTGIEMAKEIKLSSLSLPLILMSGNAAPYKKEIAVLANYFLPKPFGVKDLLSVVAKALGE